MTANAIESAKEQVQKAYIAYFGRPADEAGLAYWSNELANGADLSGIINAFGNSAESQELYSGSTPQQQVSKIYQQLFNREPEAGGLEYWVGLLDRGAISLQSIALQVLSAAANDDLTLINKKVVVASQFTNSLTTQGASHTYKGNEDAQQARDLLSAVQTSTDVNAIVAEVEAVIDSIYDNEWFEFGGNYTSVYSYLIASNSDETYYIKSQSGSSGPGNGYSRDIFIAQIDKDLTSNNQILLGNSDNQNLSAAAVNTQGGVVVAGSYGSYEAYVASISKDMQNIQSVKIGTGQGNVELNGIASASDGKIVAVGEQTAEADSTDAYIVVLNPDMSVYAERRIDNPLVVNSRESLDHVKVLSDNSIIAWTDSGDFLKFDQNLQLEKAVSLNVDPQDVVELDNGNLLFSSNDYNVDMVLMSSDLKPLNAWNDGSGLDFESFAINDEGVVLASANARFDGAWYPILAFDVNDFNENQALVTSTDAKFITTRTGGSKSLDEVLVNGDNFIAIGSNDMFTLKPNHETTPSLASDYRYIELENTPFMLQELSETSNQFPYQTGLQLEAFDVSLTGVEDNLMSIPLVGGMNIVLADTL